MNKIILTCGTSQIESLTSGDPKSNLEKSYRDRGIPGILLDDHKEPCDLFYVTNLDRTLVAWMQEVIDELIVITQAELTIIDNFIGQESNKFGAEISTLHQMMNRANGVQWKPKEDRIVLLASQTRKGLFAAILIKEILIQIYEVSGESIDIDFVRKLKEDPKCNTQIEEALDNFARKILHHMDVENNAKTFEDYLLVMSGGFKSVIPCMTMASFFFGIELIYIFESSSKLQSLNPKIDLESRADQDFWKKVWKDLERLGLQNQASWYQTLLNARLQHPNLSF